MAIITLTTDWHNNDFYIGAVKGTIMALAPDAKIIDISHNVSSFNSNQAAFILKHSYSFFPKGSIHILDVNSEAENTQAHIAFSYKDHFFIGCNNGSLGLILDEDEPTSMVEIGNVSDTITPSFTGLEKFAPAAALLANTGKLEKLGNTLSQINKLMALIPTINEAVIAGTVVYIDSYRNVITNITRELFDRIGKGRNFEILVQSYHYRIVKISTRYNDVPNGELLALFNSVGLLEIAINKGNVAELLNLGINSNIRIKFNG